MTWLRLLVLALLVSLGLLPECGLPVHAAPWLRPRTVALFETSLDEAGYSRWINGLVSKKYRPVLVSVHTISGKQVFSGLAVPNSTGQPWLARHGLSRTEHQTLFDEQVRLGFRPICVTGYLAGEEIRYASLWGKDGLPFYARHGISGDDHLADQNRTALVDHRPHFIQGCLSSEKPLYSTIYAPAGKMPWLSYHALSASSCRATFAAKLKEGYYPAWISGFGGARSARFNLILVLNPSKEWRAQLGLTARQIRSESERLAMANYELIQLSGYADAGQSRYLGVWARAALPASGKEAPELSAFDETMRRFMWQRDIPCATLAVMKDGKIVLRRGYGFADREGNRPIQPDDPFRLASVTKPITAAAIHKLIRSGKLRLDTKVFPLLGVELQVGQKSDPLLKEITVAHLLEHKGGWDRSVKPIHDPMFQTEKIAGELRLAGLPEPGDIIRYMAGQPLQFAPGTKSVYSNFGYCVLGRVIEKVSGQTYIGYIRREVLAPLGIKSIGPGRSLLKDRDRLEPHYRDPFVGKNIVAGSGVVSLPDGGFHLESLDSHGGLIGSAADLVRFYQAYGLDGKQRNGNPKSRQIFFGRLPGTWSMIEQRPDGIIVAALFNQSHCPPGMRMEGIADLLDESVKQVKKWP